MVTTCTERLWLTVESHKSSTTDNSTVFLEGYFAIIYWYNLIVVSASRDIAQMTGNEPPDHPVWYFSIHLFPAPRSSSPLRSCSLRGRGDFVIHTRSVRGSTCVTGIILYLLVPWVTCTLTQLATGCPAHCLLLDAAAGLDFYFIPPPYTSKKSGLLLLTGEVRRSRHLFHLIPLRLDAADSFTWAFGAWDWAGSGLV